MNALVKRLMQEHRLEPREYHVLLTDQDPATFDELRQEATRIARERFGYGIFIRGLIEISSYCRNDCYYCGLRRSNSLAERYRLSEEEILEACRKGYAAGFRTFVLQGGEDAAWSDERLVRLIGAIRKEAPEAAITLSLGERGEESFRLLREAGADRYLLRHEAANRTLYETIHPSFMSHQARIDAIKTLKKLGYQTGTGMMIGLPEQRTEELVEDLVLIESLQPAMIGIGPFIPHHATPLAHHPAGSIELTLKLLSILRLMVPHALIPATTALATRSSEGVLLGIQAGANVVMPNLTPFEMRKKYAIYDKKAITHTQAAEHLEQLAQSLQTIGDHIDFSRGDYNESLNL